MNKTITLGHIPHLETKSYLMIFLGVFATLWTFIEPLGFFGLIPQLTANLGILGYLSLLLFAAIISTISFKFIRSVKFKKQEFVEFIFESSSDGHDHSLRCPKNTQIHDLTNFIIEYMENGEAKERVKSIRYNYDPVLYLKRDDQEIQLDKSKTVSENKLIETDRLFIKAIPKKVDIRFSIAKED